MEESRPCCLCGLPTSTYYDWGRKWQHGNVMTCVDALRAALAHEKDRARRVVRVFWRVRVAGSVDCSSWNERADAWAYKRRACPSGKVYMVTVRRMKRKVKR